MNPNNTNAGSYSGQSIQVYVEERFDKNNKSIGFYVMQKGSPPKELSGPYSTESDAIFWLKSSGYTRVPKP